MIDLSEPFSTDGFMPHGMCYMWRPAILAVHVGSDFLIALAYFTIPFTLVYFVRKRAELRFSWMFLSFALFIVACGISHVMEIWTIWYPMYWLSGGIKVITALASIMTAILLVKLVPTALRFPTPTALQTANDALGREILERTAAQKTVTELNASLETRVAERTQQLADANQTLSEINNRLGLTAEERRQDAQQLRELSSLLTAVLDSASGVAVIAGDANLNLTIFNRGAEHLLGFSSQEIVGQVTTAVFHDPDEIRARGEELSQQLGYRVEGGAVFTEPSTLRQPRNWTYLRKDGTRVAVSLTVTAMQNPNGTILGYLGVARDITRQEQYESSLREAVFQAKLAETAVRESEERFRSLANAIPQMAHIARADGYRVWYNQRWYDYTGSTPQEMEGWGWQSVHDPALLPRDMAQWHAGITAGEPFEMEFPLRGADGSYREFMTLATPQKDAGGQVIRWITTNTDITERKRATEQFRLALEAAPTGMLMMNESGIIVLVNAQIEAVFGYPREELLGQRLEMLVPERFRSLHPGRRKAFFGDPQTRAMGAGRELYGLHKDGTEVPIEIGLNPLQTSDGHFVLSSIADITARKRADDALAKVANELERRVITRTAELKERECLLQEIHHRVKNNLQVIASLINMQIRGLEDESTRTALRDCQSRVVTMAKIHEMLYQSADYARVPFARYTRDLAARVLSASGTSPGHIALQLDLEDVSLPVAQAIPCGLILNELVANSLKHAFPNAARGVIHVELRVAPDRSVFLSVSDDGIGMPPALDLTTATSLGVQLVMNLVEQLEGHLEIVRRPGSTFRITFPPESVA